MGTTKTATATTPQTEPETSAPMSRVDIRNKIFDAKPESLQVEFFGTKIEIRQPTLGVMLEMRRNSIDDASVAMLMSYTYVPDTDEKVFETADEEPLRGLPFGPDMQRISQAVNKLLGTDMGGIDTLVEDARKSPGGGTSSADNDADSPGAGQKS